jgi:AcrR family transcriptional regulator
MMTEHASSPIGEPRRQRILVEARDLWLTVGYDDATISAIASATHLSKATIYGWWKSKEELFGEILGRATVELLDDWIARIAADPEGGTVGELYRQGFLALAAHPLMRAVYRRDSPMLGAYVRQRGPEMYTPRYFASLEMIRALQALNVIRSNLSAEVINHILLTLQVGLMMMDEVFDPAYFPSFEAIAEAIAVIMQRALGADAPGKPVAAKAAIMGHLAHMRDLIVASFDAPPSPAS